MMLASPSSSTLSHLRGPSAVSVRRSKPGASGTPPVSAAASVSASVLTASTLADSLRLRMRIIETHFTLWTRLSSRLTQGTAM